LLNKAPLKGYELAPDMVAALRDDVEKAKELFAPITRVVKVGRKVEPNPQPMQQEGEDNAG
jgi:hypothetical protein